MKILFCAAPCSDVIIQANNITAKSYLNYPIYAGSSSTQTHMTTLSNSTLYGVAGELTSQIIRPGAPPTFWGENYAINGGAIMDLVNCLYTLTWETLTSLQFKASSGTIPAGAKVLILGMPR